VESIKLARVQLRGIRETESRSPIARDSGSIARSINALSRALYHNVFTTQRRSRLSPREYAAAVYTADPSSSKQTRGATSARLPRGSTSCSAAARSRGLPSGAEDAPRIPRASAPPRVSRTVRTDDARAAR